MLNILLVKVVTPAIMNLRPRSVINYLEVKLGEPDTTQTPNKLSDNLFVYFTPTINPPMRYLIGNIRIPWFYKPNPSELSELTDPALKWQNELAEMLRINKLR